jgi:hypothetical protein
MGASRNGQHALQTGCEQPAVTKDRNLRNLFSPSGLYEFA